MSRTGPAPYGSLISRVPSEITATSRFPDIHDAVLDAGNGFAGYVDYLPYLICWKFPGEGLVSFV